MRYDAFLSPRFPPKFSKRSKSCINLRKGQMDFIHLICVRRDTQEGKSAVDSPLLKLVPQTYVIEVVSSQQA